MSAVRVALTGLLAAAAALAGGLSGATATGAATAPHSANERSAKHTGATIRRRCRAPRGHRTRARCARLTPSRRRGRSERLTDMLAGLPPASAPGSAPKPPTAPAPTPITLANVGVTATELSPTEFALVLSRPAVAPGPVRIALRNGGEDPHNLQMRREGVLAILLSFPTLDPGGTSRQTVQLTAGRYVLWCSLEGHEGLGMRTTLDVR